MGWAYKAVCTVNGKGYVGIVFGKDRTVRLRWKDHCSKRSCCKAISAAIAKHGREAFKLEVLMEGTREELIAAEPELIKAHGTRVPHGYNIARGGEGGGAWGVDAERDAKLRADWKAATKPESLTKAVKRLEKLSKLPLIEYHAEMARLKRRAQKRGMPPEKLERLYPNTFTLAEIRRMQGKTCGIPGPKGNVRLTEQEKRANKRARKRAWDAGQRTSPSGILRTTQEDRSWMLPSDSE